MLNGMGTFSLKYAIALIILTSTWPHQVIPERSPQWQTVLVSFAMKEPFETVLRYFNATWKQAGFDRAQLWRLEDFLADPLVGLHKAKLESMKEKEDRPFCGAFKPFALLRSLKESAPGDYVVWIDASQHFPYPLPSHVNVHAAIARLNDGQSEPISIYGRIECWHHVGDLLPAAMRYLKDIRGIVNAQIILANTVFNFELISDWLVLALNSTDLFCDHGGEDNNAWMILACTNHLPGYVDFPARQLRQAEAFVFSTISPQYLLEGMEKGWYIRTKDACDAREVARTCSAWMHNPMAHVHTLRSPVNPFSSEPAHAVFQHLNISAIV